MVKRPIAPRKRGAGKRILPRDPHSVETPLEVEPRVAPPPVRKKILVVDDERHSREGLRVWLLGAGYTVETAADSWQAIKKIKDYPFEVAIIDLDLPPVHGVALSGWDLVRIFRAFNPSIGIVVVGAEESRHVRTQAAQLKVSEFLEKPISPTRLKGIVSTLSA
jgi:CheY-like chemotaxis protein